MFSDISIHLDGPPSWDQAVHFGSGASVYRPNFVLLVATLWLVILCAVSTWAVILLRRSKRQNPGGAVVQELLTWKKGFWTAILCMFITSGSAIIDDGIRIGMNFVQQRYFLVQLLLNSFDYLAQIFLLFTYYNLLFQLMRWSSLRSKGLRSKYFGKFIMVRLGVCISLGIIAVVSEGISIAYLTKQVFSPDAPSTYGIGNAAYNVRLVFGILYWLAAMEVLVVSGHMVTVQRKHHLGKRKVCDSPTLSYPGFVGMVDEKPRDIGICHQPLRFSPPVRPCSIRPRTWRPHRHPVSGNVRKL